MFREHIPLQWATNSSLGDGAAHDCCHNDRASDVDKTEINNRERLKRTE